MTRSIPLMMALLLCATAPCALAEDGWISLFDGKTLDGWTVRGLGKATYEVVDGTIQGTTVEGSGNTFLTSDAEYGDFELQFDVKVDDELNSGVQIRSREKTAEDVKRTGNRKDLKRFHGPQVEIEKSPGQSGYIYGESTGFGWLSPEPQAEPSAEHSFIKNGDWNHYRIVADGVRIQTWINGNKVADLSHEEVGRTHPSGRIGLQVHGIRAGTGPYQVAWKNLRIRVLK